MSYTSYNGARLSAGRPGPQQPRSSQSILTFLRAKVISRTLSTEILPLPEGEGWGEGELNVVTRVLCGLFPVPGCPDPTMGHSIPVSRDIDCSCPRTRLPMPRHPHVPTILIQIIALDPNVSRARCHTHNLCPRSRWCFSDNHLARGGWSCSNRCIMSMALAFTSRDQCTCQCHSNTETN